MKKQIILSFLLLSTALFAMENKTDKYLSKFKEKNKYERNQLLIEAAKKGKATKMNLLISLGADVCKETKRYDNTPLHAAASQGNLACLKTLLSAGANVNAITFDRSTPLHRAATNGQLASVAALIQANAHINACDSRGNTPLHKAAAKEQGECVGKLLTAGSNVSIVNKRGQTAREITKSEHIRTIINQFDEELQTAQKQQSNGSPLTSSIP